MASLACSDCGTAVPWNAPGCAACGAVFRQVRCKGCKYVADRDRLKTPLCPRCRKDRFVTMTLVGEEIDEVGGDAFLSDVPLADDIERGFSKPGPAPNPPPATDIPSHSPEKPNRRAARHKPQSSEPPARASDDRPAPAVLKRKRWSEPADEPAPDSTAAASDRSSPDAEPPHAEPPHKRRVAFHFELSPKIQESLKWSLLAIPAALLLALGFYLMSGPTRKPKIRYGGAAPVDNAPDFEARARALFDTAVQYYRTGQLDKASATLESIVSDFPISSAADESRQALQRISQGLAPFDGSAPPHAPAADLVQFAPNQPPPPPPEPAKKKLSIGIPTGEPTGNDSKPTAPAAENLITGSPTPSTPPTQGSTLERASIPPRSLPDGFTAVGAAGVHSSGWPIEILCLKDNSHMMLVPAGEFTMGEPQGDPNAQPPHRVNLKTFYIDKHEVTLLQYKHFLEQRRLAKNPYQDLSAAALAAAASDRHPVVGVAWRDARAYADWSGKSLPTEAQWEKAARGVDARAFPWGTGEPKWERTRQPRQIDPVGSFAWDVSVFGCYDMAGNASEWCADWYDEEFYQFSPSDDPEGPKVSLPPVQYRDPERVIRGGSPHWRITWRAPLGLQEAPLHVGFRCALLVEQSAARAPSTAVVSQPPAVRQPPVRVPPGGYKF